MKKGGKGSQRAAILVLYFMVVGLISLVVKDSFILGIISIGLFVVMIIWRAILKHKTTVTHSTDSAINPNASQQFAIKQEPEPQGMADASAQYRERMRQQIPKPANQPDTPQDNLKAGNRNNQIIKDVTEGGMQRASRMPLREMFEFPELPYNFSDVPFMNTGSGMYYYLLDGNNLLQAQNDIFALNIVIEDAAKIVPLLEGVQISNIRFTTKPHFDTIDFTWFGCEPYTAAGNPSKFPLVLRFHTTPERVWSQSLDLKERLAEDAEYKNRTDIFGKIFYLKSGTIGRSEITIWHKGECFQLFCVLGKTGEFSVNRITQSINSISTVIYKK